MRESLNTHRIASLVDVVVNKRRCLKKATK